jgi:hypothetical protein
MLKRGLGRAAAGCSMLLGALALAAGAPAAQAALPTLNITDAKGSIAVSGATVSGAVNVVITSAKGLKEPSAALLALKPGVSLADVEAFSKTKAFRDPNNAIKLGSIVFDAEGVPGGTAEAQTVLTPGQYVALSPEEGQKTPPMTAFTVTASPAPAALPAAQATIKTIDFGFRGPRTLKTGEVVRFENEGFLTHMDVAIPMKSRKAALEGARLLEQGRERAVFKLVAGQPSTFLGTISTGGFQQETITAKPGWYIEACFMDTQDGREHTRLGMERVLHIVR